MRDPNQFLRQALGPLVWVAAGIGLLAILIYWIRVWFYDNDDSAGSMHELLAEYHELNQRGELSDEEYRIIKSRMAPQIRQTGTVAGGARKLSQKPEVSHGDAGKTHTTQRKEAEQPDEANEGQIE